MHILVIIDVIACIAATFQCLDAIRSLNRVRQSTDTYESSRLTSSTALDSSTLSTLLAFSTPYEPSINPLRSYILATIIAQTLSIGVVACSITCWYSLYKKALIIKGYWGSPSFAMGWCAQFVGVFVVTIGYLAQYVAFGLSCTFGELTSHLESNRFKDMTRDRLASVTTLLFVSVVVKTATITLGHGWAVSASTIGAEKGYVPNSHVEIDIEPDDGDA